MAAKNKHDEGRSQRSADFMSATESVLALAEKTGGPVKGCRINTDLLPGNVDQALAFFSQEEVVAAAKASLPLEDLAGYARLREWVDVLGFLSHERPTNDPTAAKLKALTDEGAQIRAKLNAWVDVAVAEGLIPSEKADSLPSGKGVLATGNRLVAAAMLLKENAKQIAGKAPVDGAFLEHAIEVGNALRGTGSRRMKKQSAAVKGQMEDRDKVYTLIATEYEKARRAAAYLVGVDELDKFVPPLGSRTITRHKAKAKDEAVAAPAVAAQTTTTPAASDKPALAVAKVAA